LCRVSHNFCIRHHADGTIAEVESQEDSGNVIPEVQQIADHNDAIEEAIDGILINLQRMKNESSNPNCIADQNEDDIITQQIHIPVDKSSNEDSCQASSISVVSNAEVPGTYHKTFIFFIFSMF
jgi:hypothetical protein